MSVEPDVEGSRAPYAQKNLRVNGAPRRLSELIGEFNAVLFSPADMDLVYGSPSVRRRYLDILLSQQQQGYLRGLQRYQRLLVQRNYLLKRVRDGVAQVEELDPWDEKLTAEGGLILAQRVAAVSELSKMASLDYRQLADGDEVMRLEYISSLTLSESIDDGDFVGKEMRSTLIKNREKEIRAGFTTVGPHRDDLHLLVAGMNVAQYASRGQARTAVLALRLAEGRYLSERRGEPPVLLLDDVMSELDKRRRRHVLEQVAGYEQVFITTAELELLDDEGFEGITYYQVGEGKLAKK